MKFFLRFVLGFGLVSPLFAFAAIDSLELITPESVQVNESFDVTVRILDVDGQKVTDFEGMIFFLVDGDDDAVIPFESGYNFQLSDQWEHTFAKWFTFTNAGEVEIFVYQVESELDAAKVILVTEEKEVIPEEVAVTISSPQNDTSISSSTIDIQWSTKPTTAFDVFLNDEKVLSSQSDESGQLSETIWDLLVWENTIYIEAFDGNNASIGKSEDLRLKYLDDVPSFDSLIIKEGNEVWTDQQITLEAEAEPGLKQVVASIGSLDIVMTEDTSNLRTYTGSTRASEFVGEYFVDISLVNTLGAKYEEEKVANFQTITAKIENIKVETTSDSRVRFTFDVNPDLDQIQFFQIDYGNRTGQLDQSVITFEKNRIRENTKYTWYIPELPNGEYYATITGLDATQSATPVVSPEVTFVINIEAAPTECFIENVWGVYVETFETHSVIHWNKLSDAQNYLVFKKNASGRFALVETTKENQYTVHVDMDYPNIRYEEFAIKATCKEGDLDGESYDFSDGVDVQTGPELMILFVLLAASGIAYVLLRRGYIQ